MSFSSPFPAPEAGIVSAVSQTANSVSETAHWTRNGHHSSARESARLAYTSLRTDALLTSASIAFTTDIILPKYVSRKPAELERTSHRAPTCAETFQCLTL